MSAVPSIITITHSLEQEEGLPEQLIREGYKEVDSFMYPAENNMFYDGLNRPDLVEGVDVYVETDS